MSDSEEIVLSLASVRHKKQEGSLVLTGSRIGWSPDGSSDIVSNTLYSQIKSHRLSREGSSKVQLQLILQDGNTVNFHFASPNALQERKNVSELIQKLVPKSLPKMSEEMEAKRALLQNEDLYHLYKDMVVSGLITAEEFWANRKSELESSSSQSSGLPSAFLIDAQAVTSYNSVKYNITKDDVENIFRTYPTVQKKHAELVPDKMTDEEFWLQFFQSQKFHRNRLPQKNSTSGSGLFQDCIAAHLNDPQDDSSKSSSSSVLPASDNPFQDVDDTTKASTHKQLVQRCNLHSSLVLDAIHTDVATCSKSLTSSSSSPETVSLKLSVDSPHVVADTPSRSFFVLANELSSHSNSSSLLRSPNPHFYSTMRHLLPGGSLMSNDVTSSSSSSSLSPSTTELLFRHQRSLAELLRHFWACFPVVNQQLEQKLHRMAQCLQEFRDKQLAEFNSQVDPLEQCCIQPLLSSVNTALVRYQEWLARQKNT